MSQGVACMPTPEGVWVKLLLRLIGSLNIGSLTCMWKTVCRALLLRLEGTSILGDVQGLAYVCLPPNAYFVPRLTCHTPNDCRLAVVRISSCLWALCRRALALI